MSAVPRYSWPSQRRLIPVVCAACGARLIGVAPPSSDGTVTDVTCYACARIACELRDDRYHPMTPAEFAALEVSRRPRSGGPKPRPVDAAPPTCCDCGVRPATRRWRLCDPCMEARQRASHVARCRAYHARQKAAAT